MNNCFHGSISEAAGLQENERRGYKLTQVKSKSLKGLSVFLAVLMVFTMLPGSILKASAVDADSNTEIADMQAGTDIQFAGKTWTLLDPSSGLVLCDSAIGSGVYGTTNEFKSGNAAYDYLNGNYYNSLSAQEQAFIQNHTWTTLTAATFKIGLFTSNEANQYSSYFKAIDQDWFLGTVLGGTSDQIFRMKANQTSVSRTDYISVTSTAAYRPALYLYPYFKLAYNDASKYCLIDVSAVNASGSGYTYSGGDITLTGGYTYVLYGTATANSVTVPSPVKADVILASVDIESGSGCAFSIEKGASVNLTLNGKNALKSGIHNAGLQVPDDASLTITENSTGSLEACCDTSGSGAGIGGGPGESGGSVTINGGAVTANGAGAGIGGGIGVVSGIGNGGNGGTVIIGGGTVIANGHHFSAGIGGGSGALDGDRGGNGGTVIIRGGNVTANGDKYGAGIGSGAGIGNKGVGGNGGTVTISGGTAIATGGVGIGRGNSGSSISKDNDTGRGAIVSITGTNTTVTAEGQNGEDIGAGNSGGNSGSLTVGDDNVTIGSLPTVNLRSAGTNAATTFKNCVINNAASTEMTGTYNADGYIPMPVSLTATLSADDSKVSLQASVSKASDSDTYNGAGNVTFSTSSDPNGGYTAVDGGAVGLSAAAPAAAAFSPAPGKNYTVKVEYSSTNGYRKGSASTDVSIPSDDASLSGLAVTSGELSPDFSSGATDYMVNVGPNTGSIAVTPTANESHAAITVNGSAVTSGSLSNEITLGDAGSDTTINILVTAQNGNTKPYTVKVHRAAEAVSTITVSPVNGGSSVAIGDTLKLSAAVEPTDAIQDVNWIVTTDNGGVALPSYGNGTISENSDGTATFTGTKAGTIYVKATAKDGSGVYGFFTVHATSNESISISSPTGGSGFEGGILPLTATVTGGGASPTITWAIDNDAGLAQPTGMSKGSGTITDNKDGTATFNATTAGYVYVKATADGVSSKPYLIYIYAKGTSETEIVTVSGSNTVATGGALQLSASVTRGDSVQNVCQNVTWGSSDNTVATVDSGGKVTGVKAGKVTITATASDGSGVSGSADITVTEAGTAPTITISSLPDGILGAAYSQALTADGNTPITWSVQSGSLPDGLNLDPSTGTISGTPTKAGDFTFTVQAANDFENDTKELSIHIETAASGNTYGIRLTPSLTGTFTFDPQTEGYDNSSVSGLMVGVWNTGNQPTGDLTAALSGTGKDFFTLSLSAVGSIDVGRMNGFTVAPKTGLSAGTYTATLTVSGGSVAPQSFDVSFTVTAAPISSDKAITAFSIGGYAGTIDESKHTVAVTVPGSADVTKLAPIITVSKKATVSPASGAVQDFTKPVTYTVTAQNNTKQDYTVTVTPDQTLACGIDLSQTEKYIFPTQAAGYSPVFPLDITVQNTGNQPTGALSVTLSGAGKDSFGVYPSSIDSINAGGSARFSITPNLSLPQGVYTATVTVFGVNVTPQSFEVSFTVNDGSGSDYTIGLSQTGQQPYTFASQTTGYGGLTPLNVTVTSTGAKATGDLSIVLGGLNSNSFTLSKTAIGSISPDGTDSFTVVPNTGLPAGTYVATVAVFGDNVTSHFFTVVFTVNSNGDSGGNGGSGSGGGDSSSTSYQATAKGNDGSSATLSVTTSGSSASVSMGASQENILQSGSALVISMPTVPDATSYDVKLPASDLSANAGGTLAMNTGLGSISLPSNMLSSTSGATDKTARITISEGDSSSLPGSVKAVLGDRPVIQLMLSLGGTQSEWNNPDAPVTVSIPYTPTAAELQNPDSIVVWYIDGSGSAVCVPNGHYDASTGTVTFKTTHFSQYAVGYNHVSFSDVTDGAWYKDFVNYLSARNIVGGTGDGRFSPEANITRAQFVTILARMSGESLSGDTSSAFSDVSRGDWCFAAVQWASKNGIAAGSGGKFAPNADITREEMAAMLYRYAKYAGIDVSNADGTSVREFHDYDSISDWALTPIQWAFSNKIASGNGSGNFAPQEDATRAEAAKMTAALAQRLVKV